MASLLPPIQTHHEPAPESLHPGAYWYAPRGDHARLMIGEKRADEYFIRLINGRQYSRCRPGDVFIGPLPVPGNIQG
ncbi:MAG: hypothetical protein RLZZ182_2194 [Pseudomonadota bacterium]|jgi:hypothetical protein